MHIQIINFNIKVSGEDYEKGAMELAPVFADLPGLINNQTFTKTANCWGVRNNTRGTNSNRIVVFRK